VRGDDKDDLFFQDQPEIRQPALKTAAAWARMAVGFTQTNIQSSFFFLVKTIGGVKLSEQKVRVTRQEDF
jgi:hypothetical protein